MAPPLDPVPTDPNLPASTQVVVIGGGIIGVCTAFFLARKGVPVVLCEKGVIAGEQSSRNWGWCRTMARDPLELPLAREALRLWADMNAMARAETGFRRSGIAYLCRTAKELERRQAWLETVGLPAGVDTKLITRDQAARVLPGLSGAWAGAMVTPSDGRAEPGMAAPAIALAARAAGAVVMTGCAVRGIETSGGRVCGVVTEKGRVACRAVVLAGGVWSRLFCRPLGIRLPQLKILSAVMRTEPLRGGPEASASGDGFGFRKRLDGGYTLASWTGNVADVVPDSFRFAWDFLPALSQRGGEVRMRLGRRFLAEAFQRKRWKLDGQSPFEAVRTLDPPVLQHILRQAQKHVVQAFPVFHEMRVAESWGGMIDVTPDGIPVISGVDGVPGFFIATGFSGHGFGIAPAAGRLMAELVMGETPVVDAKAFRYNRFTDGTRPRPSPLARAQ
jgi:glycine/D-amino acid oxidase-like deaminating enzyme